MIQFQYQVLRYQPDKVGEEFMNLGVVVFAPDSKECAVRVLGNEKRLAAFFPAGSTAYIMSLLQTVANGLRERNVGDVADLGSITKQLLPGKDSALFFTEVRVGLDTSAQSALDNLYVRLVTRYAQAEMEET